ncbi:MAG TPA: hypothetical protein VN617_05235 [Rhodoferax sp.]|jgi:hypothetical protein|nr:hypothetical protein [Rhodoferax sp.]
MKLVAISAIVIAAASLSACVVAPVGYGAPGYVAPAYVEPVAPPVGVVVIGPTYASPGPDWAWRYHPRYGWGWFNPHRGWHRGWR